MPADLVVIGLGYVGLPVVVEAARAGLRVAGYDLNAEVVAGLNAGRSHVDDISDADVRDALTAGFQASAGQDVLRGARSVIICVPTPLRVDGGPDLGAVIGAAQAVARHLQQGMLVVLESTTYPGTTDELVRPILEAGGLRAGRDFALAFSPERIDPGNPSFGLRNTPKVVGGATPGCTATAAALYGKFVDRVVQAKGTREAEMAKLLENTYRHVNIALVNEMAIFCQELGIDLWDAIDCAATKPFGFHAFRPGPGVGGHCIPIDPNYLSYRVRSKLGYQFRFVELAQEINARMPAYVVQRAQELLNAEAKPMKDSKVLLLGVTYKADIADQRESPARPVAARLRQAGAQLSFHDPYVERWSLDAEASGSPETPGRAERSGVAELRRVPDVAAAVQEADLVILLQRHAEYDADAILSGARRVLDTRGVLPRAACVTAL